MRKRGRMLAVLLSFMMITAMLPANAFAADTAGVAFESGAIEADTVDKTVAAGKAEEANTIEVDAAVEAEEANAIASAAIDMADSAAENENADISPVGGEFKNEATVTRVVYSNHISKAEAEIEFMFKGGNINYLDPMIGKKKGGYEYDIDTQDPKNLPKGWSLKKNGDTYTLTADPLHFTMSGGVKPPVGEEIWVGVAVEGSKGYGEDQLKLTVPEEGKKTEVKSQEESCTHKKYGRFLKDNEDGKTHSVCCEHCGAVLETCDHAFVETPVANGDGTFEGKYERECECGYHEEAWCKHEKFLNKDKGNGMHTVYCSRCSWVKGWEYHNRKYETPGNGKVKVFCEKCDYAQTTVCRHPYRRPWVSVGWNKHAQKCTECNEIFMDTKEDCSFFSSGAIPYDAIHTQHVIPCSSECGNNIYEDHKNKRKLFIVQSSVFQGSYTIHFEDTCESCGARTFGSFNYYFPRKLLFMFNNLDNDLRELVKKTQEDPDALKYLNKKFPNDDNKAALIGKYALQGLGLGGAFKSLDGALLDYSTLLYEQGNSKNLNVLDKDGNTVYNGRDDKSLNSYGSDGETLMQVQGDEQGQEIEPVDLNGYDEVYVALSTNMLYGLEDGEHTLTVLLTTDEGKQMESTMVFTIGSEIEDDVKYKMVTSLYPLYSAADAENKIVDIKLDRTEIPWTGEAAELPEASLKKEDTDLVSGTDYTLSYFRITYDNDGKRQETLVNPEEIIDVGTYMVKATAVNGAWTLGTPAAIFRVAYDLSECGAIASVEDQEYTSIEVEPGVTVYATVNGEERKLTRSGAFTYSEEDKTFTQGDPGDFTVSYSDNTDKGTAIITVTGEGDYMGTLTQTFDIVEHTVEDAGYAAESWNLFDDKDGHEYEVSGVNAPNPVKNSNAKSSKYFDATLSGDKITVSLLGNADRKKAAANNTFDFDLGENGALSYTLPVTYNKPVLKLTSSKGTIRSGQSKTTPLKTTVLMQTETGNFAPCDLSGLSLSYSADGVTVTPGNDGEVTLEARGKSSGKLVVTKKDDQGKDVWNEQIQLKYAVSESNKDVIFADTGALRQVVLNKNAPDQVLEFPLSFNGEAATGETVEIVQDDKSRSHLLGSIGDGILAVSIGRSGLSEGSYTLNLKSKNGDGKLAFKVKISGKPVAATGKVKQKYDFVTGAPMLVIPTLKECSGKLLSANVVTPSGFIEGDFNAEIEGGNVLIDVSEQAAEKIANTKGFKVGDMNVDAYVEGVDKPVRIPLKNVSAKKTNPTVKTSKVVIPKEALEKGQSQVIAEVNVLSTYKDGSKYTRIIRPDKVDTECAKKNVDVHPAEDNKTHICITKLDGASGTVKAALAYPGGIKKSVNIKVSKGK